MNDILLQKAEKWFAEIGIRTLARPTCLCVSRDDIANLGSVGVIPETTNDEVLNELRGVLASNRIYWGGKDDEWLYLQAF